MPYTIQGTSVDVTPDPFEHDGKHFVPLRGLVDALGGNVNFDNETKASVATIGQWEAHVKDGETHVDVSGTAVNLTAAPFVQDDQFFVPFDFFRDAYGYEVSIDGDTMHLVNPNAPAA